MKFDVMALPSTGLNVVGSRRAFAPYNAAHEELRIEVTQAAVEAGPIPERFEKASLTVVCYVGREKEDGKFRAETVNCLHPVLDPIYRALIDLDVISSMDAVPEIRTILVRDCETEGFRIVIEAVE